MNEQTAESASEIPVASVIQAPGNPAEQGLRSSQGIRWLLLVGALVTGVSVFRLVQSQWAALPVPLQFLILVGGALTIFGMGMVTRQRLRLPSAGAALLYLFTGLVPVLAWGAAYLHLLGTAWGWVAFGAGVAALLGATRRVLRSVLGYQGLGIPAALGALVAAQPVLPWLAVDLANGRPDLLGWIYAAAAVVLGAVLFFGSRHANRFFFHRDRRDGIERPVHWVPFALLGLLYGGALTLLDPLSLFLALPVAVIGMVLAGTGEEYYAALAASLGSAPQKWPRRSVALIGIGFALVAAAVPLSLRDDSLRCLVPVAAGAALLWGRWGLRYKSAGAWAAGIAAGLPAYSAMPALAPQLAHRIAQAAAALTRIPADSPALAALGQLGFLGVLAAAAGALRRIDAPEKTRRTHAVALALHATGVTALALLDPSGALLVLPAVLAPVLAGVAVSRRIEIVPACQIVFGTLVLAAGQALLGEPALVTGPTLRLLGLATLAVLAAGRFSEGGLARFVGASLEQTRRALVWPAAPVVIVLAFHGASSLGTVMGGIELALAGAVLTAMAFRVAHENGFAVGSLILSLGAHAALYDSFRGASLWLALLSQAGFALCYLASRRRETLFGRAGRGLALWHTALGLLWLIYGLQAGTATIEPLILLLAGLALLREGFEEPGSDAATVGLGLLAAWLPVQVAAGLLGWSALPLSTIFLISVAAGTVSLAVLILTARRGGDLSRLVKLQGGLSAVACLIFTGPAAFSVAVTLAGLVFLARTKLAGRSLRAAVPLRPSLLVLLQLVALMIGGGDVGEHSLLGVLIVQGFTILPALAAGLLIWRLAADALGRRWSLEPWASVGEGALALGYLAAFVLHPALSFPAHAALLAAALGWSALSFVSAVRGRQVRDAWTMQAWAGIAVLHAFTAGWLYFGSAAAPYVLLGAGAGLYVLAAFWKRGGLKVLSGPCRRTGLGLPLAAGVMALVRTLDAAPQDAWFPALAAFLVSLFYLFVALHAVSNDGRRMFPSLAAAGFLAATLLAVTSQVRLGAEFYSLGPGLALLALAWMLRTELGQTWSRHLAAAGAACVYATPIVALSDQISWGWLAALLVLTVAFGAASFALRSRSLLTVSTAALLTDLGFFVFRIGTTAPMVLWILGLAFGLALMGTAAWIEFKREGVLQQIRVFGRELNAWN
jgi:hypothetical protein